MIRTASRRVLYTTQRYLRRDIQTAVKDRSESSNHAKFAAIFGVAAAAFGAFQLNQAESAGVDIKLVKQDIITAIENNDEKRGDGTSIAPTLIRLAWHASGTYSVFDKTGGSNYATMRFAPESQWGANAGLKNARDFLEPIRLKYNMSTGDIWTLAGATAVEAMGGPVVPWRAGRVDAEEKTQKTLPDGRLPNANAGCPHATNAHIRDIFGRMGFNDREIVALCGAHVVGRCHPEASGFWGPWTNAETTFSNQYFVLLLNEKWVVKTTHEGKPWKGPFQYESAKDPQIMMLPADLWLLEDPKFRKIVEEYAGNEQVFYRDFAAAFSKLMELGVPFPSTWW